MDVYLHSLRLLLIVVAIFSVARGGLVAVSIAMSQIELTISGIGQLIACRMVQTSLSSVMAAVVPSFKTAGLCAAGVLIGKILSTSLQLHGLPALGAMALPAAVAFLWLEAGTARELVSNAFGAVRRVELAHAQGERA
jgi:hypothetical protein